MIVEVNKKKETLQPKSLSTPFPRSLNPHHALHLLASESAAVTPVFDFTHYAGVFKAHIINSHHILPVAELESEKLTIL